MPPSNMLRRRSTLLLPVCILAWNFWCASARDLPEYIPMCRRLDPNFDKCLIKSTETIKPFLIKGIPELKVPPIEPFLVPQVMLEQGSQALNFKAVLSNIIVDGLSNYTCNEFHADFDKLQALFKGKWFDVKLRGDYEIQGKVLVVPITSTGKFTASFTRGNVDYLTQIGSYKKKGREYYQFVNSTMNLTVENPKLKLDGEFLGGEELSEVTKKTIDDNIDLLFEDMKPVIEKILSNIFEGVLFNNLAGQFSADTLFGPSA